MLKSWKVASFMLYLYGVDYNEETKLEKTMNTLSVREVRPMGDPIFEDYRARDL